jgi:hypothetical protein
VFETAPRVAEELLDLGLGQLDLAPLRLGQADALLERFGLLFEFLPDDRARGRNHRADHRALLLLELSDRPAPSRRGAEQAVEFLPVGGEDRLLKEVDAPCGEAKLADELLDRGLEGLLPDPEILVPPGTVVGGKPLPRPAARRAPGEGPPALGAAHHVLERKKGIVPELLLDDPRRVVVVENLERAVLMLLDEHLAPVGGVERLDRDEPRKLGPDRLVIRPPFADHAGIDGPPNNFLEVFDREGLARNRADDALLALVPAVLGLAEVPLSIQLSDNLFVRVGARSPQREHGDEEPRPLGVSFLNHLLLPVNKYALVHVPVVGRPNLVAIAHQLDFPPDHAGEDGGDLRLTGHCYYSFGDLARRVAAPVILHAEVSQGVLRRLNDARGVDELDPIVFPQSSLELLVLLSARPGESVNEAYDDVVDSSAVNGEILKQLLKNGALLLACGEWLLEHGEHPEIAARRH